MPEERGGPPLSASDLQTHQLAKNIVKTNRAWRWGASHSSLSGPVWFLGNGTLTSPWGLGTWGTVAGPWRRDALHVQLNNATHLLMFLSEKWSFVAVRCSDERVTYGRLSGVVPEERLVW